jgi:hypothetical protein
MYLLHNVLVYVLHFATLQHYRIASVPLKRLDTACKSPLLSHFSQTLDGLPRQVNFTHSLKRAQYYLYELCSHITHVVQVHRCCSLCAYTVQLCVLRIAYQYMFVLLHACTCTAAQYTAVSLPAALMH